MNEGQRKRTGSLSLQLKSGASTAGAASRRTSSRHIYISYIEFILLIHIINSYTKFIVLIHNIHCRLPAPVFQGVQGSQGGNDHWGHAICSVSMKLE